MYIAIVHMDRPVTEREKAKAIGLTTAQKFANVKRYGLLMKFYLSGEAGSGGVYVRIVYIRGLT